MKKKSVIFAVMMLLVLVCLTGCTGKQRFVIEVDKNGVAELDSSTVYYAHPQLLEWADANKGLTQADVPDWVNVYGPHSKLMLNYEDTDSVGDPIWDNDIYLQTQFNADILVYDRMLSQSSTSSVYEIGIFSGNYDITNVEKFLNELDCQMTVVAKGSFGLKSVTLGTLEFVSGGKYITYKNNSTWVIDIDALVRDNWSVVVNLSKEDGIPSILMNFSTSAVTNTSSKYRQFTDVPTSAWYSTAVNTLAWNGFINGIGNDRFAPDSDLTVAQVCKLMTGIVAPDLDTTNPTSYWAYPYIKYCVDHYWVEDRGTINAKNYDVPIRRAEAIHAVACAFGVAPYSDILRDIYLESDTMTNATWKALEAASSAAGASGMTRAGEGISGCVFTADGRIVDDIPDSAFVKGSVDASKYKMSFGVMYAKGFVNGNGNGDFNTTGYLTRAEFCQVIYNMMYYDFSIAEPHHASSANFGVRVDALYVMLRGGFDPRNFSGQYEYYGIE